MSSLAEKRSEFEKAREAIVAAAEFYGKQLPQWTYFRKAWQKGICARENGWERLSPYYEDELRTPYWLAGFDDLEFVPPMIPTAVRPLKQKPAVVPVPETVNG